MTALDSYLAACKTPDGLFGDIQKHVLKQAAKPSGRSTTVIHPSEVIKDDFCVRASYLLISGTPSTGPKESITFRRENIFIEGHNTHAKWQRWLTEMGRLAGLWTCPACGGDFWNDVTPLKCADATCGFVYTAHCPPVYAEVPLTHKQYRIGGKTDGYVPDQRCLIEVKTLGLGSLRYEHPDFLKRFESRDGTDLDRLWREFRRPLSSARRQGMLYLWLARTGGIDVDRILFIYDAKFNQETKSFMLDYDPDLIAPVIEKCKLVSSRLDVGLAPSCNINPKSGCSSCRRFEES